MPLHLSSPTLVKSSSCSSSKVSLKPKLSIDSEPESLESCADPEPLSDKEPVPSLEKELKSYPFSISARLLFFLYAKLLFFP